MRGYGTLFAAKLKMLSIYRGDFIMGLVSSMIKAAVGILFLNIIFLNFSDVGGIKSDISRCFYFSIAIVQALINLFFMGLVDFSGIYIRGGNLETVLLKPVNKIAYIIADNIDIREIPNLIVNLILYIFSISMLKERSFLSVTAFIMGPILALGTMVSAALLINCLSFRFRDTLMATKFAVSLSDMCRYPLGIYRKEIQYILTLFLPIGAVQIISCGSQSQLPLFLGIATLVTVVLLWVSTLAFSYTFRWYESAGS